MSSLLSKAAAERGMQEATVESGTGSPASTALPKLPSWSASGWQTLLKQPSAGAFQQVCCACTCRCIQYTSLTCTGSTVVPETTHCSCCLVPKRAVRRSPRNFVVLVPACNCVHMLGSPFLLLSLFLHCGSPWPGDDEVAVLYVFHVCCLARVAISNSNQAGESVVDQSLAFCQVLPICQTCWQILVRVEKVFKLVVMQQLLPCSNGLQMAP